MVTIYGKKKCTQCDMSVRVFDSEGVSFAYVDMEEDAGAFDYVTKTLGLRQAPVVVARYPNGSETHWSGFRPDKIKGYARTAAAWSRDV